MIIRYVLVVDDYAMEAFKLTLGFSNDAPPLQQLEIALAKKTKIKPPSKSSCMTSQSPTWTPT